jgi:hypothetical protein
MVRTEMVRTEMVRTEMVRVALMSDMGKWSFRVGKPAIRARRVVINDELSGAGKAVYGGTGQPAGVGMTEAPGFLSDPHLGAGVTAGDDPADLERSAQL